jgi:hypothetical protein
MRRSRPVASGPPACCFLAPSLETAQVDRGEAKPLNQLHDDLLRPGIIAGYQQNPGCLTTSWAGGKMRHCDGIEGLHNTGARSELRDNLA